MQLANFLPKFFKRHKVINLLLRLGLQSKISKTYFNEDSVSFIDLTDPEPRNVYIKGEFEKDFFKVANSFISQNGVFFLILVQMLVFAPLDYSTQNQMPVVIFLKQTSNW